MSDKLINAIDIALVALRETSGLLAHVPAEFPDDAGGERRFSWEGHCRRKRDTRELWKWIERKLWFVLEGLGEDKGAARCFVKMLPKPYTVPILYIDPKKLPAPLRKQYHQKWPEAEGRPRLVRSNWSRGSEAFRAEVKKIAQRENELQRKWDATFVEEPAAWLWVVWKWYSRCTGNAAPPGMPEWPGAGFFHRLAQAVLLNIGSYPGGRHPFSSKDFPGLCPGKAANYLRKALEKLRQRDFDAFVTWAKSATRTTSFKQWAGGHQVTLAIVFTDVVGSTALGDEIKDEAMNKVRRAHFAQSRKLIRRFKGRAIKTMGDGFMAAFKSVGAALDYALALHRNTGHPRVQIRAGIHIGSMKVEQRDVFGGTVDFAARVIGAIKGAEIWLSHPAKEDIDGLGAARHKHLKWRRHERVAMKGFPGPFTLWSVKTMLG